MLLFKLTSFSVLDFNILKCQQHKGVRKQLKHSYTNINMAFDNIHVISKEVFPFNITNAFMIKGQSVATVNLISSLRYNHYSLL